MKNPTDEQIKSILGGMLGDGFNRCLGALRKAGAIDTSKLDEHYTGMGSKYYDLVSEQTVITVKYGAENIRRLFADEDENPK